MFNKKKTCFIITPIGDEKDEIRRHIDGVIDTIITPIMESEYEIQVAHRLFQTGSINKQIIELIYKSDLVIANLTQTNPNVMYELAFRHTLGLPTITMAEKGTKLPFDISSQRTIFYQNDFQGVNEAQAELKNFLSQIDYSSGKTTGPIHDYLDSNKLNNLIYNKNQNNDKSEILDLMVKRLEGIENTILRMESETISKLSNNNFNEAICDIQSFKVAKISADSFFAYHKINIIRQAVRDQTAKIKNMLFAFSQYLGKTSSLNKYDIIDRISEYINEIDKLENEIYDIIDFN